VLDEVSPHFVRHVLVKQDLQRAGFR
jgi:hypothetical protein